MRKIGIDIIILILYLCISSIGLYGNQIKYSMNPLNEHSVQLVVGGCFFMETMICRKCGCEKAISEFSPCATVSSYKLCGECRLLESRQKHTPIVNLHNEIWDNARVSDNVFYDTYFISNKGRVKSKIRTKINSQSCFVGEAIIKPYKNKGGYLSIKLCNNSTTRAFFIHRIVALSFIPNPENKPFINHKDCNKLNNNVENLEWCTRKENMQHASKNNLLSDHRGENCGMAKLTNEQVISIRNEYVPHKKLNLAKRYGISTHTLNVLVRRKTWTNI